MLERLKVLTAIMLLSVISAFGASVKLTQSAGYGKRSVEVGSNFYIYVEVSDIDAAPETPKNVPGAKVLYFERTGQSSRFTSVNGKTTQSFSYTYTMTLRAAKEGTFSFGPITVGGVSSNAVSYTIGKQSEQPASRQQQQGAAGRADTDSDKPKYIGKGDGNLYLRANVSKTTAYEQQALVYTVKLYTTYEAIKFIGATAAPKFDGFVVEESKDVSKQLSYETVNGKTYATAVIARYIIFPQMTGPLKISGNTYTVSVDQREYYHDPWFGSMSYSTPLQLNVTPNDLTINVNPLPAPKPVDFSGGVGQFNISSQLDNSDFKSNQAASIKYVVTGTGNVKYVQLPDLAATWPKEIEIYTPKTDVKTNVGSSSVSGSVSFDYSFMPLEEGEFTLPPVKLVYFNPETGKYETAVSKSYDIKVGKGKDADKPQARQTMRFNPELKTVKVSALSLQHKPYIKGFAYWLWFIIPFVLLIATFAVYRNYVNSHADMAAFNSRRADKLARRRLKKAAAAMARDDANAFYDELLTALWGYIGDKLKMPGSELMRDNIRQVLESKGISAESINRFVNILDKCEYAKYSSDNSGSSLRESYQEAIDVINATENAFKK